jgi:hypothetical protein
MGTAGADPERKARLDQTRQKRSVANEAKKVVSSLCLRLGSTGVELASKGEILFNSARRLYIEAETVKFYAAQQAKYLDCFTVELPDDVKAELPDYSRAGDWDYSMQMALEDATEYVGEIIWPGDSDDSMEMAREDATDKVDKIIMLLEFDPIELAKAAIEEAKKMPPEEREKQRGNIWGLERRISEIESLIAEYDDLVRKIARARDAFVEAYRDYEETAKKYDVPISKSLEKHAEEIDDLIYAAMWGEEEGAEAETEAPAEKGGETVKGETEGDKGEGQESRPKPKKRVFRDDIEELLAQIESGQTKESEGEVVTGIEPVVVSDESKQKRSRANKEAGEEKTKAGKEKAKGKKKKASAEEEIVKIDIDTTPAETPKSSGKITGQTRKRRMRC